MFTNVELAEFYNEHFVCYAIDAADNNTDMFMGYEVHIVPMVILLDSKKTERYRIVHRIKPDILLRLGKAVTGEAPTLEEMFQACTSPKNVTGYWVARTESYGNGLSPLGWISG